MRTIEIILCLILCLWWPLSDPGSIKFLALPVFVYFCIRQWGGSKAIFLVCLCSCLLLLAPSWEQRHAFMDLIGYLGLLLGLYNPKSLYPKAFLIFAISNLFLYIIHVADLLPWETHQPFVLKTIEIYGASDGFPGLVGNPSPLCLILLAGLSQFNNKRLLTLYLLLSTPLVLQSTSTIGILLFLFGGIAQLLGIRVLNQLGLLLVICVTAFILLPDSVAKRPLETRSVLWKSAFIHLSFWGNGSSDFQRKSGLYLSEEANQTRISRNQFHPHNDLLWHLYAYGVFGFLLRLLICFYLFIRFLTNPQAAPLLLAWFQAQFTPDLISFPAGFVILFLSGAMAGRPDSSLKGSRSISICAPLLLLIPISALIHSYIWSSQIRKNSPIRLHEPKHFLGPTSEYNLIVNLISEGKTELALIRAHQLQSIAPDFFDLHYLMALAYLQSGDYKNSRAELWKMLQIQPEHLYARQLLADIQNR